jgi:hypothetical protein
MAALEAVGMTPNKYPARWIFNLMAGDSPLRWKDAAPTGADTKESEETDEE